MWLNYHIIVDPTLINMITGLGMQGPNPQDYYPGKTANRAISHKSNSEMSGRCIVIQVDIDGHPPFLTGSKQFSDNFGNLLFLAVLTSGAILRA
jgi:hypothetical protein